MREITVKDIYRMQVRNMQQNIIGLDYKMSYRQVSALSISEVEIYFKGREYKRILDLGFYDIEDFVKKFKKDCNEYMLQDVDKITINGYLNFLEAIK